MGCCCSATRELVWEGGVGAYGDALDETDVVQKTKSEGAYGSHQNSLTKPTIVKKVNVP